MQRNYLLFWLVVLTSIEYFNVASAYELIGVVRDFKRGDVPGGHPDFQAPFFGTDLGIVEDVLGVDRKPIYAGDPVNGTSTTTGLTEFDQWYRDVQNVNQRKNFAITIEPDLFGNFFYDSQFFPIDDELFGNEGLTHNFHFTTEFQGKFTYTSTSDYMAVGGDDDVWLFINNELAVDLGGVRPFTTGSVDFGSLGLSVGQEYSFALFHAERQTGGSELLIDTSLVLRPRLPGDYNDDGRVDAIDYTVWRNNLNTPFQLLNEGPGVTPGMVTSEDYQVWKSNYGNTAGAGSLAATTVPEPTCLACLGVLVLVISGRRSLPVC